jgi:hypothetical protein
LARGLWGFVAASPTVCFWSDGGWRGPLLYAPRELDALARLGGAQEGDADRLFRSKSPLPHHSTSRHATPRHVETRRDPTTAKDDPRPLRRPTRRANAHSPRGAFGRGLLDPRRSSDRTWGRRRRNPTNLPPQPPSIHHQPPRSPPTFRNPALRAARRSAPRCVDSYPPSWRRLNSTFSVQSPPTTSTQPILPKPAM